MEHLQSNPIKSGTFLIGTALTASWQFGGWGKGTRKAREQRGALHALPFLPPPGVSPRAPLRTFEGILASWPVFKIWKNVDFPDLFPV